MNRLGELLSKHRNLFLFSLLTATLAVSTLAHQERLQAACVTVDIPVTAAAAPVLSPLESFRRQRDQDVLSDISALEKLIAQTDLDEQTRLNAAERLQAIIDARQVQSALEGALSGSSLHPCAAVLQGNSLTIVTGKSTITDKDAALVLSLAAAHTSVAPQDVRIVTAE